MFFKPAAIDVIDSLGSSLGSYCFSRSQSINVNCFSQFQSIERFHSVPCMGIKTTKKLAAKLVYFQKGRGFIGYPKGRNRDIKLVN